MFVILDNLRKKKENGTLLFDGDVEKSRKEGCNIVRSLK